MPQCPKKIRWFALAVVVLLAGCASQLGGAGYGAGVSGDVVSTSDVVDPLDLKGREILTTLDPLKEAANLGATTLTWLLTGSKTSRLRNPVSLGRFNHQLYIVDAGHKIVFRYDTKRNTLEKITAVESALVGEPGNIFVRNDGSFFIVDSAGSQIHLFDYDGGLIRSYRSAGNLSKPVDVVYEPNSKRIYVADAVYSHIVVFDQHGRPLHAIGMRGKSPGYFHRITTLALEKDEMIVLDALALPMQVLERDGSFKYSMPKNSLVMPVGVAVDGYGRVFVNDGADNQIKIFKDRKLIGRFGGSGVKPGKFRGVTDMLIMDSVLYIADSQNGRVQRIKVDEPYIDVGAR